jgi:preprotein translocase subunit SecD
MFKSIKLRSALVAAIGLVAIFYLLPSLTDNLPAFWKENLTKEKIHLGLDLQGGTHLVLEVDTDKAVESTLERTTNNLKETLMEKKVRFRSLERKQGNIVIEMQDGAPGSAMENILKEQFPDLEIAASQTTAGKETATLRFRPKRVAEIKKLAVEQSLETIRNRVDQFGVSEPEIIPEGMDRIIVQLPGIKDTARAKNLIGKTALLEFKMVNDEQSLDEALKGNIPEGSSILYGSSQDRETGRRNSVPYLLKTKTLLTGESLESAQVKISDRFGESYVSIKFNAQGANDFERITGENVKKRMAIVLDGTVHSAPVIQEKISGGQAQITGSFTIDEARRAARPRKYSGGEDCRTFPRAGFYRKGPLVNAYRRPGGRRIYALLLQTVGYCRQCGASAEYAAATRRVGRLSRDPHPAGDCRHRADHRDGGRCQRADF